MMPVMSEPSSSSSSRKVSSSSPAAGSSSPSTTASASSPSASGASSGLAPSTAIGGLLHAACAGAAFSAAAGAAAASRHRRHRELVDGAADRAGDGIAVEVVEAGAALGVLARALGAAFGFGGHGQRASTLAIWRAPCHAGRGLSKANRRRRSKPARGMADPARSRACCRGLLTASGPAALWRRSIARRERAARAQSRPAGPQCRTHPILSAFRGASRGRCRGACACRATSRSRTAR